MFNISGHISSNHWSNCKSFKLGSNIFSFRW